MSGSSKSSTPTSDLRRLTLGSRSDMAVQTRSQRKRAEPPSSPSSRGSGAASSSRVQLTRATQQQRRRQQSPDPPARGHNDNDDDDEDDSDGSDSDTEQPARRTRSEIAVAVDEILSVYHPGDLLPNEYSTHRSTTFNTIEEERAFRYRALGDKIIAEAMRNHRFLPALESAMPRRTDRWAYLIADRQIPRLNRILQAHNAFIDNRSQGLDIEETARILVEMDDSICRIIRACGGDDGHLVQAPLVWVLLEMLHTVVQSDRPPFRPETHLPSYAGGEGHSLTLYRHVISHQSSSSQPMFVLRTLASADPRALARRPEQLARVMAELQSRHYTGSSGRMVPNPGAPIAYMDALDRLVRLAANPNRQARD